jgi:UDP-N-acetylglucosamine 2-epimerase (non-hydrolysing)
MIQIVKLAKIVRVLYGSVRFLHSGLHTDAELSGVFRDAAASLSRNPERHLRAAPPHPGRPDSRSYDRVMPEELSRRVTGVLAVLHCDRTADAVQNLRREDVPGESILADWQRDRRATAAMAPDDATARASTAGPGAEPNQYILAAIQRSENSDDPQRLQAILDELSRLAYCPRSTRGRLAAAWHCLPPTLDRLQVIPPAEQGTFLGLARHALLIVSQMRRGAAGMHGPQMAAHVVRNSMAPRRPSTRFAHLVQPGPAIGELGQRLIGDRILDECLPATHCPFGDGRASERITGPVCSYPYRPPARVRRGAT